MLYSNHLSTKNNFLLLFSGYAVNFQPSPIYSYLTARFKILDYSGGQAATVGSVLVTNLKTGFRKGDSDRVEVLFAPIFFILE